MIITCFLFFFPTYAEEIFLSLKKNKVNVRSGPSFESPIKFIYKKKSLPIKQIDKKDNFRRIIDSKNNSGWIHISQLKKNKSIIRAFVTSEHTKEQLKGCAEALIDASKEFDFGI